MGTAVYKGITIPSPEPTGGGGALLVNGLKALAASRWNYNVDANIVPDGDATRNLGTAAARMNQVWGHRGAFVSGAGTLTRTNAGLIGGTAAAGASILGTGVGGFAHGSAVLGVMQASGEGAWAGGRIAGTGAYLGYIQATTYGALAFGNCGAINGNSYMVASGAGSIALGYTGDQGNLLSQNLGSVAAGYATGGGTLSANNRGAIALGYASASYTLESTGRGALALGYAKSGNISATAAGCFQLGVGSNSQAYSLQVSNPATIGGGVRLAPTGFLYAVQQATSTVTYGADTGLMTAYVSDSSYGVVGGHAGIIGYARYSSRLEAGKDGCFVVGRAYGDANIKADGVGIFGAFAFGSANYHGDIYSSGSGSIAGGYAYSYSQIAASADGAVAFGYAYDNGYITAGYKGSLAWGLSIGGNITAGGVGSVAGGYNKGGGTIQSNGTGDLCGGYVGEYGGTLTAGGKGNVMFGTVDGAYSTAYTSGYGSAVFGGVDEYATMYASAHGSHAHGYAGAGYSGYYSTIAATAVGAFAFGYSDAAGRILSYGKGSFAGGFASGYGEIQSGSDGSFAFGSISGSGYVIQANAYGAFAFGYASSSDIQATATNAIQFGPGSNGEADTLSVGGGIRIKGTGGAPAAPRNGDIWVYSNYVYIRSNGSSVKVVACP